MRYRRATLYAYSGTGNSRRVAAWMADAFRASGWPVILAPLHSARPTSDLGRGEGGLLVLVLPTHGFTAPWAVLRFALDLPRGKGTDAEVVATRGSLKIGRFHTPGYEGTATLLVALILAAKGYRICGTAGVDMPSNWTALHPGLPPDAVGAIIDRARARTGRLSDAMLSGGPGLANWRASLLGLLLLPISLSYLLIGRLFLARLFFASDACTGCGGCARACPRYAIAMRGTGDKARPYWTFRCDSCMRCMAYCPTGAVEVSHLLAAAALLLAGSLPTGLVLAWLTGHIPALGAWGRPLHWILMGATGLVLVAAVPPLLHALLNVRAFNWLWTHTTPTHAYRRYREPGTTLAALDRRDEWTPEA